MTSDIVQARLSALAHPQRQLVYRHLMRYVPSELAAGDIAKDLGLKASTLSVYLSALSRAGLVTARRCGPKRWYRAVPSALVDLLDVLHFEVAYGRANLGKDAACCMPRLVFVDQDGGGLAPLAEAAFRRALKGQARVSSCGINPADDLDPLVSEIMSRNGQVPAGLRPRALQQPADLVVALTASAARDAIIPTGAAMTYWPFPAPPQKVIARAMAFQQFYDEMTIKARRLAPHLKARSSLLRMADELSSGLPEGGHASASLPERRSVSPSPALRASAAS